MLAKIALERVSHAPDNGSAELEILRDVRVLMRLVDLCPDDKLDSVVRHHPFQNSTGRSRLVPWRTHLLKRRRNARKSKNALGRDTDALNFASRGQPASRAQVGKIDLNLLAELALDDVRRRSPADYDMVVPEICLSRELEVMLLVERRS